MKNRLNNSQKKQSIDDQITKKWKLVLGIILGNFLELYDHAIFGIFSYLIVQLYFPTESPLAKMMYAYSMFATGFVVRPVGGLLFGYLSNRLDKRVALSFSLTLMAISTVAIGLMPTYNSIGILAPILLIIARIFQGLSMSWEFPITMTVLSEISPRKKGLLGSLSFFSGTFGMLAASLVSHIISRVLTEDEVSSWGWRVPFVLGAIICVVGIYIRKKLILEEDLWLKNVNVNPLVSSVLTSYKELLITILISGFTGAAFFPLFFYLPKNLIPAEISSTQNITLLTALALMAYATTLVLVGFISDIIKKEKIIFVGALLFASFSYPLIDLFTQHDLKACVIAIISMAVLLALIIGPVPALISELFPKSHRAGAVSIGYNIGISILGGLSPLCMGYLHSTYPGKQSIQIYFIVIACIMLIISLVMMLTHTAKEKEYGYI